MAVLGACRPEHPSQWRRDVFVVMGAMSLIIVFAALWLAGRAAMLVVPMIGAVLAAALVLDF